MLLLAFFNSLFDEGNCLRDPLPVCISLLCDNDEQGLELGDDEFSTSPRDCQTARDVSFPVDGALNGLFDFWDDKFFFVAGSFLSGSFLETWITGTSAESRPSSLMAIKLTSARALDKINACNRTKIFYRNSPARSPVQLRLLRRFSRNVISSCVAQKLTKYTSRQ